MLWDCKIIPLCTSNIQKMYFFTPYSSILTFLPEIKLQTLSCCKVNYLDFVCCRFPFSPLLFKVHEELSAIVDLTIHWREKTLERRVNRNVSKTFCLDKHQKVRGAIEKKKKKRQTLGKSILLKLPRILRNYTRINSSLNYVKNQVVFTL